MTNKNIQEDNEKVQKKSRKISSLPARTFEETMQIAQGILECASSQKVRRLNLFGHLDKSPGSGPSRTLITSSFKYGITNGGYQAEYLELTDSGKIASGPDMSEVDKNKLNLN